LKPSAIEAIQNFRNLSFNTFSFCAASFPAEFVKLGMNDGMVAGGGDGDGESPVGGTALVAVFATIGGASVVGIGADSDSDSEEEEEVSSESDDSWVGTGTGAMGRFILTGLGFEDEESESEDDDSEEDTGRLFRLRLRFRALVFGARGVINNGTRRI
jgi:hypothetical protein